MEFLRNLTLFINDFFLYYIVGYSGFLFLSAFVGAFVFYLTERRKKYKNEIMRDYYYPVSIIVPAYNEEVTIIATIDSLLGLDYKLYEIIVVDDGSRDNTLKKIIDHYNLKKVPKVIRKKIPTQDILACYENDTKVKLTVVSKKNGGKADALNAGINASNFPYFLTIDADSILLKDSLTEIIKPVMEDSTIICAGGVIKISNGLTIKNGEIVDYHLPKKYLEMVQTLEYDRTFMASRAVFDLFNGNLIVSGAFGLFKKKHVIEIGGYRTNTVGEDMEIVLRLHDYAINAKIPYRIKYVPEAICYTQAPNTLKDFKKQRKRWQNGLFQSLISHRNMCLNPRYGLLGSVSFLYYWIYEFLAPLTETVGLIFIFISYFLELMNLKFMLIYFAIYLLFCTTFSITTFFNRTYTTSNKITIRDLFRVVFYSIVENIGFRQLVNWYRLSSFFGSRSSKMSWAKITRTKMD